MEFPTSGPFVYVTPVLVCFMISLVVTSCVVCYLKRAFNRALRMDGMTTLSQIHVPVVPEVTGVPVSAGLAYKISDSLGV